MGEALLRPTRRQHTVSRVVLRRFTRHGELTVYDRSHARPRLKSPGGVFYDQLDTHDSWTAEQRWGKVETKMKHVFDLIDDRTILDDADAVDTLRDLIAMHWIRTPALREPHERILAEVTAHSIAALDLRPDILTAGMRKRTGLHPGGAADLAYFNRRLHADVLHATAGQMMSSSLARLFARARRMFADLEIQIGYSDQVDFVIGDAPVIACKPGHDGAGLHQGVALGDANEIVMPISPHVIIGLGQQPALHTMLDDAVHRYNQLQIQTFIRRIAWQPNGYVDKIARRTAPDRTG